jgi:CDP-diacylglycerol pyrophosphatase
MECRRLIKLSHMALLAAALALVLCDARSASADPDVLWKIVHGKCVPNQIRHHKPAPCAQVDIQHGTQRGHAVLKDIRGATQYLLIPTARVAGIESPALLRPNAPNYWAAAWAARNFVFKRAGRTLPRDAVALAINSAGGRSQNQLHIHVDCLRVDVRDDLRRNAQRLSHRWKPLGTKLVGYDYLARRLDGASLRAADPFRLLARGVPSARRHMGEWTLVAAPMTFEEGRNGFVLLADRSNPATGNRGHGEDLLDHSCALARDVNKPTK